MKKLILIVAVAAMALCPFLAPAQGEPQDIAPNADAFRDAFYESLRQKGIENYDKAITALERCRSLEPDNATVYFELGKNYLAQKNYKSAYDSFERATQIEPKNKWFWVGMYDVCYETRDWERAIVIVNKLIQFKKDYEEDLVSLYMNTQQFDKALALINKLNDTAGKSDLRDNYKMQILQRPQYQGAERDNLIEQIRKNPKDETNYVALIFLYNQSNQEDKATQIAQQLEREIPDSDWAQVSLFKSNLNAGNGSKAAASMLRVMASSKIDNKIKQRMLNEFLIFSRDKPELEVDLDRAIGYLSSDRDVKTAKEIGKFYHNKKNWDKAAKYYEMHLSNEPGDIEATTLLFEVYSEQGRFEMLAKKADAMTELYPLQPQFYYFGGLANNQLHNYKKAKDLLESGIDYIVDDKAMEINYNIQLGEAYNGLGDAKKKELYFSKADKLMNKKG